MGNDETKPESMDGQPVRTGGWVGCQLCGCEKVLVVRTRYIREQKPRMPELMQCYLSDLRVEELLCPRKAIVEVAWCSGCDHVWPVVFASICDQW